MIGCCCYLGVLSYRRLDKLRRCCSMAKTLSRTLSRHQHPAARDMSLVSSTLSQTSASLGVVSLGQIFLSSEANDTKSTDFLAIGVVILISIAIGAGIVFLIVLLGILWTLFSRRDEVLSKFDPAEIDDDDDSTKHRPSSLLAHINAAATSATILGGKGQDVSGEKEATAAGAAAIAADAGASSSGHDPLSGPDASNYLRAETPSDAFGGGLVGEETGRPAHARYSFDGSGEGEMALVVGQELEILDDRDHS